MALRQLRNFCLYIASLRHSVGSGSEDTSDIAFVPSGGSLVDRRARGVVGLAAVGADLAVPVLRMLCAQPQPEGQHHAALVSWSGFCEWHGYPYEWGSLICLNKRR